jgi:hypothetical protein
VECFEEICGLAHLRNWGFAIAEWAHEFADLRFPDFDKKLALPTSGVHNACNIYLRTMDNVHVLFRVCSREFDAELHVKGECMTCGIQCRTLYIYSCTVHTYVIR